MKLTPVLFAKDMQATMDFYIPLGFEARDVMQEGDEITSMKLIYRDNENVGLLFLPEEKGSTYEKITLEFEEGDRDIEWHQVERYGDPREGLARDPNGYKLKFTKG